MLPALIRKARQSAEPAGLLLSASIMSSKNDGLFSDGIPAKNGSITTLGQRKSEYHPNFHSICDPRNPEVKNDTPTVGETIRRDFMMHSDVSVGTIASALETSIESVEALLRGRRGLEEGEAAKLARMFATSEQFWLDLDADSRAR